MKKLVLAVLLVVFAVSAAGCFGPQKLTRSLDDWTNQMYVESPWLAGNVISYYLIGLATNITWFVDGLIFNTIDFWGTSAQPFGSGTGTAFVHKAAGPAVPKGK